MELSERMLKVDTRVFILHLRSLPLADLSTDLSTWLPTGGRGPCLPWRRPSRYVGMFAVFIKSVFQWLGSLRQIPASDAGGAPDLPTVGSFSVGLVSLSLWLKQKVYQVHQVPALLVVVNITKNVLLDF